MISFRREKHVPRGGPNGGDGGSGGEIVFVANERLSSLVRYHRRSHFRAPDGGHGGSSNKTGARGESLRLEVPEGTTIRDSETGELLADLTEDGQEVVLLSGGRGGRGNARFASSTNQAPRLAERGEPGQEKWLILELKLIADVGIIGVPNAGKSTLLSVVSAAKPKIDSYPFTTLQPNLGVVELDGYETMVMADIPGLIEGASAGIGLGHDFLRHIERTKILIHLLDGASANPIEDWAMINQELSLYDVRLERKPQVVVLNKIDLPDAFAWLPLIEEKMASEDIAFCSISALNKQGVRQMLYLVKQLLDKTPTSEPEYESLTVIRPKADPNSFVIDREADGWRVRGLAIERVAAMTYWEFEATVRRFQQILERMGISEALEEAGISEGDTVYIGDEILEWNS